MPRRTSVTPLSEISEINMTPLMDLTFILLITFIITFPLIEQGIPVNLPKGDAQEVNPDTTRTISVDAQGQIFLDELKTDMAGLKRDLTLLGEANPDVTVLVRADEGLQYGKIMEVMKTLHEAKITKLALITQAEQQ